MNDGVKKFLSLLKIGRDLSKFVDELEIDSLFLPATTGEKSTYTDTHVDEIPDFLSWKVVSLDILVKSEPMYEVPSCI
jgi:hypothetical protein